MTIKVRCACGQKVSGPDHWAGRTGKCPHCGADVRLSTDTTPAWSIAPAERAEGQGHTFFCTFCGKKLAASDSATGNTLNCPHCRKPTRIPQKPRKSRKLSRTTGQSWSMHIPAKPIEIKTEPKPEEPAAGEEPFKEIPLQTLTRSRKPKLAPGIGR